MADRALIASRIARILSSGHQIARVLVRSNTSKNLDVARALENLQILLGTLRILDFVVQARHISPDVLQIVDDTTVQCEDLMIDLESEKKEISKHTTPGIDVLATDTWQSLGTRIVDENTNLLIALQHIPVNGSSSSRADLEEQSSSSNFPQETQMIQSSPQMPPTRQDEPDFASTVGDDEQQPSLVTLLSVGDIEHQEGAGEENWLKIAPEYGVSQPVPGSAGFELVTRPNLLSQSNLYRPYSRLLQLLSSVGLIETPIPPGCVRMRWKNRHGRSLYDDYTENRPGALEKLQGYFSHCNPSVVTGHPFMGDDEPSSSSVQQEGRTASSAPSNHNSIQTSETWQNLQSIMTKEDTQTDIEMGSKSSRPLLLLLCIERRGYPDKLHQEAVTDILDDSQLFRELRRVYKEKEGYLRSFWSLRTLGSIQFMKFIYEGHPNIDVRCHADLCERAKCMCVPPKEYVFPKGIEYDCSPIPPGLSPPVGSKHMMDLFNDPDGYKSGATRVLQQIPKKMNEYLRDTSSTQTEAWGLCFKEEWNHSKIWWLLGIVFGVTSLLFGVLWGVLQKDVQGAFGIAGWWLTGATIFVGMIGTY